MGVIERIRNRLRANLADLIARMENPERDLEDLVRKMEDELREARMEVSTAVREERRLSDDFLDAAEQSRVMAEKAALAIEQDAEDLAREALTRKVAFEQRARRLERKLATQREAVQSLREALTALEGRLEEARHQREVLIARRRLQAAQRAVRDTGAPDRARDLEAGALLNEGIELMEEMTGDTLQERVEHELIRLKQARAEHTKASQSGGRSSPEGRARKR